MHIIKINHFCIIHNKPCTATKNLLRITCLNLIIKNLFVKYGGSKKNRLFLDIPDCVVIYLELVYLVTALVPSETACLASSPGRRSLTAVWISREVMVDLLL